MEITAFTIAALAGAAVLFTVGVVLIWLGFRNRAEALPSGADDILDAIAGGTLAPPSRREYGRDMTGEHVRLVPASAADIPTRPTPVVRAEPEPEPIVVTDDHDDDESADSDEERQPVGVGMLQTDDTGEMPAPARNFFSGQPELKRF